MDSEAGDCADFPIENITVDITYSSSVDIAGFQFSLDNGSVVSAGGGDAAANGFTVSAGGSTVLGFSLTGATIPAGSGTLVTLEVSGAIDPCIADGSLVLSDPAGQPIETAVDCLSFSNVECDDVDADGVCDDEDDCVGEFDECGVCNLSLIHI